MRKSLIVLCAALLAWSCGKDESNTDPVDAATGCGANERCANDVGTQTDAGGSEPDMSTSEDMTVPTDMSTPVDMTQPPKCERTPLPENGPRKMVVALPYLDTEYEVFDISAQGEISRPNVRFSMARGYDGEIQFTPDGQVGFSKQDDGTLGIFRINSSGQPEVLAARHDPGFYVSGILIDANGDNLYAWETGFRKLDDGSANGALYRLPIACASGMVEPAEEVFRAKLIRGADWLTDTKLALAAVDLLDDETPNDVHLVDLAGPTRLGSESAFPDDEAITAGFTLTRDGLYMLVGDNSAFSGVPNRVGVVGIQGDNLIAQQVIEIADPVSIFISPHNNAALVASGTGDELVVLDYNPGAAASPFAIRGPLVTTEPVLLPFVASMIERGDLDGMVVIAENVGIRRVQFEANGGVTDLGLFALGDGIDSIPGSLGIQP